ncbi:bifunctional methylenetetrahydrofolate dehydrogenase/methenyltetrahydrofolate cyclohydrolase FolD [Desulfonatronum thioautotrophicum]|uniref:bifunctional methylenetetrahydrofolate dehydrogenase/methenyltetrahydrofolate cyclohydrolase FolD n=1 Tax=Desulfonatronum thioautotrophicum TaxID=617001 RepID=UPI0005EBB1C0|nr:bifunctional methylenetetrahydrofolate dehydrogenase/methenyltetrahydrofolate cyclohydrolase FolD [Desulfonatronum thioautotrophicum]
MLLDGKRTAATIREELRREVADLAASRDMPPGLAVILVGDDPASQVYVRNKERACAEVGIVSRSLRLPGDVAQDHLEGLIRELNADRDVHGILLQLPLPQGLKAQRCLELIDPKKDVDGFHPENMGRLTLGLPGLRPCTPAGVLELLARYDLSVAGKKAVVVGRSNIVGKPLALLLAQPNAQGNATVTLCHSRTPDLAGEMRRADFLFLAVGRPRFATADMVAPEAVVVDVGINRTDQGLVGDADFQALRDHVAAITPVPGGIGPMTIAQLLRNTFQAYAAG